jgi:hypothetical protein
MPMRDAAGHLAACLESVAAQTLEDHELVVVDDGSRDACAAMVAAAARRDPRVRLLRRPREGIVAALNQGLAAARAPLVARMDADDVMHPERLALQVAMLEGRPDLVLVASRVRAFPEAACSAGTREYLAWQNACIDPESVGTQIYVESPFTHPSVTFRRDVVLAAGGYHAGAFPEDYQLWLRLHAAGHGMSKVDRVLLDWRQHPGSLSRTDPRCAREAFDALRAAWLHRDPRLDPARPLVVWGAGRRTRRRCRWLLDQGRRVSAWVDIDPRKVGNRVQGVPVHPPQWLAARRGDRPRPFVLGYVASHGARERIGQALEAMGYRAGADYLMVG